MAHPRASWAAAFGLRLPRPGRWPAPRGRDDEGSEEASEEESEEESEEDE